MPGCVFQIMLLLFNQIMCLSTLSSTWPGAPGDCLRPACKRQLSCTSVLLQECQCSQRAVLPKCGHSFPMYLLSLRNASKHGQTCFHFIQISKNYLEDFVMDRIPSSLVTKWIRPLMAEHSFWHSCLLGTKWTDCHFLPSFQKKTKKTKKPAVSSWWPSEYYLPALSDASYHLF